MMKVPLATLIPLAALFVLDSLGRFTCPIWFELDASRQALVAPLPSGEPLSHADDIPAPPSDGTFNGFDLYHVNHPPQSHIHCVGENFQDKRSWLFRSCEYTNFCFNVDTNQYYIYADEKPLNLADDMFSSTEVEPKDQLVSGGAQPKTWFPVIAEKKYHIKTKIGSFRPTVVYAGNSSSGELRPASYYRFNATILPFFRHPRSYQNPGHLIWDDFLSLYTLLDVFDRTEDRIMLSQMVRPKTDDFEEAFDPGNANSDLATKFLGLLGHDRDAYNLKTLESFELQLKKETRFLRSEKQKQEEGPLIICADHAVMGSGTFSDHGESHWHGQSKRDFDWPLNMGRGGLFRRFRHFMMTNMGVNSRAPIQRKPYYKIVVAASSSDKPDRADVNFDTQVGILRKAFEDRAQIMVQNMTSMSAKEQLELASTTAIYMTVVGGGSVTGFFLPKGATVILFYGVKKLDWDFWNNFPDVNVHWMPLDHMHAKEDLISLVELVGKELSYLDETSP